MVLQSPELRSLDTCLRSLKARWQEYRDQGNFEHFVEFTLALDNLTEHLNRLKLPGLLRQCEGLENAALALFVPFAQGLILRGVIGSAIGTLVGKKIAEHDPAWFRKRLELALDRFEEINSFFRDGRCSKRARDEYVEDLIERFFDRADSLLE